MFTLVQFSIFHFINFPIQYKTPNEKNTIVSFVYIFSCIVTRFFRSQLYRDFGKMIYSVFSKVI